MRTKRLIGFIGDTDPRYGGGHVYQIDNETPWLEYHHESRPSKKIMTHKVILDKNYTLNSKNLKELERFYDIDHDELIALSKSEDAVDRAIFAELLGCYYGWECISDCS
jgi:hypothetical protein